MESQNKFFLFFETANSKVMKKEIFNRNYSLFVPDFFLISLYVSLLSISGVLDRILIILIFYYQQHNAIAVLYSLATVAPFVYVLALFENEDTQEISYAKNIILVLLRVAFTAVGMDSITVVMKVIRNEIVNNPIASHSFFTIVCNSRAVFHTAKANLSLIKTHCIVSTVLKCVPQLHILSVYLSVTKSRGIIDILALVSIVLNMAIFSFTMATAPPIRKNSRVFTSCLCVVLNSFCKFMATMCACGAVLMIFTSVLNNIGYYALLVQLARLFLSALPTVHTLHSLPYSFQLKLFCGLFWLVIFAFIFIHPFEGVGKLIYYYYYLLIFLVELAELYLLTTVGNSYIFIYLCLKVVMIGFLSIFGLLNILKKEKEVCIVEQKERHTEKQISSEDGKICAIDIKSRHEKDPNRADTESETFKEKDEKSSATPTEMDTNSETEKEVKGKHHGIRKINKDKGKSHKSYKRLEIYSEKEEKISTTGTEPDNNIGRERIKYFERRKEKEEKMTGTESSDEKKLNMHNVESNGEKKKSEHVEKHKEKEETHRNISGHEAGPSGEKKKERVENGEFEPKENKDNEENGVEITRTKSENITHREKKTDKSME